MRWLQRLLILSVFTVAIPGQAQPALQLLSQLPYAEDLSDVWGYVAPDSTEYALVGVFDGVSIVSLANPAAPEEVAFLPGAPSIWRDIKTWEHYAYVTNETGGGLTILDLSTLPGSPDTTSYRERELRTAHNLFIDSQGIAWLFGANIDGGGVTLLDLATDPLEPVFIGAYTDRYVHDGYVRGDTLFTADIQVGEFSIIDFSDREEPLVLGTQVTPIGLTHNVWLSDDGRTLAVTEEYPAGNVLTYDISDPTDIRALGEFRSNWDSDIIPHNVYYRGNWLVTSYYRDGVTLTDATRPENLVGTGTFDTSPFPPAGEFNGCWGVYPFLPSGHILATDIEEGLFVLKPEYRRAAYVEGTVRDILSGLPRQYARVELLSAEARPYITGLNGAYFTGTADSGLFTLRIAASGCNTAFIPDVLLVPGQRTELDVNLDCFSTGVETPAETGIVLHVQPAVFSGTTVLHWSNPDPAATALPLRVYNAAGQSVLETGLDGVNGQIRMGDNWPAGMYWLFCGEAPSGLSRQLVKLH